MAKVFKAKLLSVALAASALGLIALSAPACRPPVGDQDPVNLRWDEDARQGYNKAKKLQSVDGIRVLAWNVAWGSFNGGHDIDHNLLELARSASRPDVVVLTEFKPVIFTDATHKALSEEYPHYSFVAYEPGDIVGIAVYSTHPFTTSAPEQLEWVPMSMSDEEARKAYRADWLAKAPMAKYWNRPYVRMRWDIAGFKLNLVPLHLLQPWDSIKNATGRGKYEMWKEFVFSRENPLMYQTTRLIEKLRRDFGHGLDKERLMVIGDFNFPKRLLGVSSKGYEMMTDTGLDEIFPGEPSSFPSFSSPQRQEPPFKYSMVKIDHAFHNKYLDARGAAVLPLRGSDHYPIYVVADPR